MPISKVKQIQVILKGLSHSTADIRLVPDIFGFQLINQSVSTVAGLPVVNLSLTPMDGANRYIKAFEDKLLAALILLAISSIAQEHLAIKSRLDWFELIQAKTNSALAKVGKSFDFKLRQSSDEG